MRQTALHNIRNTQAQLTPVYSRACLTLVFPPLPLALSLPDQPATHRRPACVHHNTAELSFEHLSSWQYYPGPDSYQIAIAPVYQHHSTGPCFWSRQIMRRILRGTESMSTLFNHILEAGAVIEFRLLRLCLIGHLIDIHF